MIVAVLDRRSGLWRPMCGGGSEREDFEFPGAVYHVLDRGGRQDR